MKKRTPILPLLAVAAVVVTAAGVSMFVTAFSGVLDTPSAVTPAEVRAIRDAKDRRAFADRVAAEEVTP